jgi:tetratricopeptide (TPR) repeat protein
VPYKEVWRTGANSATTINFSDDVIIGGKKIAPGKYGLLTIPGSKDWIIILSKQTNVTSPADYKADQDMVRVNAPVIKNKNKTESFTIALNDIRNTSCNLVISWDKLSIALPIQTEIDEKIMANIEAAMKTEKPPYYNAAMYYMDNGKDLNQALSWFTKATEANPTAFWIHYQRANCLAKLGRKSEAIASAEKSKQLATDAKNGDYVKLNEKLIAELNK